MTTAREETSRLADLLRREHHALADFLLALAAFDRERRWSDLGYNSLFSFLVRELGLSKGAAFYRNRAAELVQKYPDIVEPLRDGRLCLSSVAELSSVLTPHNVCDVLPRFFHLSRSEAKTVTAELRPDPAPPLRTVVTAVPPALPSDLPPCAVVEPAPEQTGFPENLVHANSGVPDVARPVQKRTEVEPLTAELRRMHVTVSRHLLDKLARARNALSHSNPGASDDEILQLGLDLLLERQAKRRGLVKKPRKAAPRASETPAPARRSRYIPAAVRRAVWERDRGCCQWKLEGGGICGSPLRVEIDHIEGWAKGAGATVKELRILCRVHQDASARQLYGDAVMDRYTRRKGGTCSEPVASYGAVPGARSAPGAGLRESRTMAHVVIPFRPCGRRNAGFSRRPTPPRSSPRAPSGRPARAARPTARRRP